MDPGGWGGRGDHPPPVVAENCVCSNSNFSPTGAITPPPPPSSLAVPPGRHPPPPPPSENPVSAPVRGGPYTGGGGYGFSFSANYFFSFPRPNNKFVSLVDPNKISPPPLGNETIKLPPPPLLNSQGQKESRGTIIFKLRPPTVSQHCRTMPQS